MNSWLFDLNEGYYKKVFKDSLKAGLIGIANCINKTRTLLSELK